MVSCEGNVHQLLFTMQEVQKVLFLVSYLPGLRGRWQLASLARPSGGEVTGPLAMRHACCLLLDFAALAVQQQPFCPPVSPHEQVHSHIKWRHWLLNMREACSRRKANDIAGC